MRTKDLQKELLHFIVVVQSETAISEPEMRALKDALSVLARVGKVANIDDIDARIKTLSDFDKDTAQE